MKIAISVVLALFLVGCGNDDSKSTDSMDAHTQEVKAMAQESDTVADEPTAEDAVSDQADDVVSDMSDNMQDSAEDMADSMKDTTDEMSDNMHDAADDMTDNMQDSSSKMTDSMHDSANSMADSASDSMNAMGDAMTGMMPGSSSVSGKEIFKVCSTCHGVNAEKSALGKSQIIRGWDSVKIENALHGYKEGTYGGAMKAVMKGQVSKLDSEEIEAVAEYISNL